MIARVWRGWTTQALADTYEGLLRTEIFPGILAKQIPGFLRIELFRRELGHETEFMTVMWFTSQAAVTAFVGEDHDVAYVPASARRVLARFDERAAHYEVRASCDGPGSLP
jgi:heme-degrading monooxygenase HmoA